MFWRLIIILALCGVFPVSSAAASLPIPTYFFPVQYENDVVAKSERGYFEQVLLEEMGAMFWMRVIAPEALPEEIGESAAKTVTRCETPRCANATLKKAGIERVLVVNVRRIKRRIFQVDAAVLSTGGKTLLSQRVTERGGESELKYAAPGILEKLFESEIQARASRITSIVESTAVTSTEADKFLEQGDSAAAAGDSQSALNLYEKAAEQSPTLAMPLIKAAEIKLAEGNAPGALQSAQAAVKRDTESGRAYMVLGEALLATQDFSGAEHALSNAVRLDARQTKAFFLLGTVRHNMGQYLKAADAFKNAVALSPELLQARVNLGMAWLEAGRTREAMEALEAAIEADAEQLAAYPPLARALELGKRFAEAADTYARLAERMEGCAACRYNQGRMLEQAGESDEARGAYEAALSMDEGFLDARYNLGALLVRTGDCEGAREQLSLYVEQETRPDQKAFVKEAKGMLSKCGAGK